MTNFTQRGSSPWARGTPSLSHLTCLFRRFIPVGTGNTSPIPNMMLCQSVHPRGHGEHIDTPAPITEVGGSSPWARGTHAPTYLYIITGRFIPVGTGNTNRSLSAMNRKTVHPRGHGEHLNCMTQTHLQNGSSPWARGTPSMKSIGRVNRRFIPVGTGNTF